MKVSGHIDFLFFGNQKPRNATERKHDKGQEESKRKNFSFAQIPWQNPFPFGL